MIVYNFSITKLPYIITHVNQSKVNMEKENEYKA